MRLERQAGLNKGEARHALARAVFAHSQGRVHDRFHDAQQKRVMALNLVIAEGDRKGYWSVRVSANWRIVFRFEGGNIYDVDLIDYH